MEDGSLETTVRILAESYNIAMRIDEAEKINKIKYFYETRVMLNSAFCEEGDLLLNTSFEQLKTLIEKWSEQNRNYDIIFDLPSLILIILFLESKNFREVLKTCSNTDKKLALETIYDISFKVSFKGVNSTKHDFLKFGQLYIEIIGNYTS